MTKEILRPSRGYKIDLKIKGESYTNDISRVRMTSSLATGYPIITITINISPQTILLKKLYGQDEILLDIYKLDADQVVTETTNFDVMFFDSSFDVPLSDEIVTGKQEDRSSFDLITIPRLAFETMTTMVNPVFGNSPGPKSPWTGPKTTKEMIETIVSESIKSGAKLEYDSENENKDKILQCCVPPTTLYKCIKELDKNFGLFSGAPAVFCSYDNTIKIMNLSSRIKKNYDIFVEHLTTESKESDLDKATKNVKNFYTYDNLYSNYVGNSKFGVIGKTIKHIVLPSNELSNTITQDLSTICKNYGVIDKTSNTEFINKSVAKRTKYYIDNNGFETSATFAISNLAKQIADTARIAFSVEKNLAIENLIKVGSCVKLKIKTHEHQDISGKYILFSSDIVWNKGADWETTAALELIRTNKTI